MQADITSANIVGYSTETTREGTFTQITPVFTDVADGTKISLSNLSFTPARFDNIQIFDENGDVKDTITYSRKGTSKTGYTYYWKSDVLGEVEDYDFPRGSSLWLQTASACDLTQAGAVAGEDIVVTLPAGTFAQTGNCTPVAVTLSQLTFSDLARFDNIQMFDENGDVKDTLTYSRKGTSKTGYTYYWKSDLEGELDPEVYTFAPGAVFWVQCAAGGTLTIPSPIKK